jgi:hypothetical protein
MKEKTYNGWTNYETWAVALWIDQQQSTYHYWRDEARRHRQDAPACQQVLDGNWTVGDAARYNLADKLKDHFQDAAPLVEPVVYRDLLQAALSEVDWSDIAEHLLAGLAEDEHPIFGPVIFAYTRAQAIQDGVLVDVTEMAQEAGLKHPTAVTAAVWADYVAVPEGVEAQDEQGRLWDILMMLRFAIQGGTNGSELLYEVLVRNDNTSSQPVKLKAICGPGDSAEPVLTIMLPHED